MKARKGRLFFSSVAIAVSLLLFAGFAGAQLGMFLKLGDIKGESLDNDHKDWIEISGYSFGLSTQVSSHLGGGGGASVPSFSDITISKVLDSTSPAILLSTAAGTHHPEATIDFVTNVAQNPVLFYQIVLSDVITSAISQSGGGTQSLATEDVTLNFAKIQWMYQTYNADGSKSGAVTAGWDLETNKQQ